MNKRSVWRIKFFISLTQRYGYQLLLLFFTKTWRTFFGVLIGNDTRIICSKSAIVDVAISVSSKTFRCFGRGPSPFSSIFRSFGLLVRNMTMLEKKLEQQYVLQHKHNISLRPNSSVNITGFLFLRFFVSFCAKFRGNEVRAGVFNENIVWVIASQPFPILHFFLVGCNYKFFCLRMLNIQFFLFISISIYLSVWQGFKWKL